jgi:hypothetical protein
MINIIDRIPKRLYVKEVERTIIIPPQQGLIGKEFSPTSQEPT